MSQFRNISDDARSVAYGLPRPVEVAVDGVVTVDDTVDESYACQPDVWKPVVALTAPAAVIAADPVAPEEAAE